MPTNSHTHTHAAAHWYAVEVKNTHTHTHSHQHSERHTKTRCQAAAGAEILFYSLQQKIPERKKTDTQLHTRIHFYQHGASLEASELSETISVSADPPPLPASPCCRIGAVELLL